MPPFELLSYCFLLVVAGNETTRNATSGGLLALIQHPAELEKLRRDPTLVDAAVEEIVRWTSPVIQFCRTPIHDVELRGQRIPAGENLCLFYPSANRDEEVFEDPFAFRVDRTPNPHLGFGIGEHFCLGANLARLELRIIFRQLVERLEKVELAGPVARLRSSFVGGIKRCRSATGCAPRGRPTAPPEGPRGLRVPERVDDVHRRRFARGVEAEEEADADRDDEGDGDADARHRHVDAVEEAEVERQTGADQGAGDAAGQAEDAGLDAGTG